MSWHRFVLMSATGTIKTILRRTARRCGFITPDDGSDDVFAHVDDCSELGDCQVGDACNYDLEWYDRKGKYKATNFSKKDDEEEDDEEDAVSYAKTSRPHAASPAANTAPSRACSAPRALSASRHCRVATSSRSCLGLRCPSPRRSRETSS